jgi:ligand-binding sensor domain-containing protein
MKVLIKTIQFVIVSFFIQSAFSQTPYFRKHPLPSEFKTAEVTSIIQGADKFLWFGTSMGLLRFDGLTFRHIQNEAKDSSVTALFEDSRKNIWVGFRTGKILKLRDEKFSTVDEIRDIHSTPVTGFAEDARGRVWVATYGEGLLIVGNKEFYKLDERDGLGDNFVYSIISDKNGNVYAGTDRGLAVCTLDQNKKLVDLITTSRGLPDNIVTALSKDSNDNIWIGTDSEGIARFDYKTKQFLKPHRSWKYGRVTSIMAFSKTVWIGTSMHGVIDLDPRNKIARKLNNEDITLPARISDISQDSEGNIWLASATSTVLSGNRMFTFLKNSRVESNSNIQSILYASNSRIWFSTNKGVYHFDLYDDTRSPARLDLPELQSIQIISLFEDKDKKIWFGTFDHGVFKYDPVTKKIIQVTEKDGLINNNVLSIAQSDGHMWFATLGGISECEISFDKKGKPLYKFSNYTSEHGIGSNYIYKIYADRKNRLWFATDGKGITVRENGAFKNYYLKEGLKSNVVYSVTEDAAGTIWMSTANAGIYRLNGNDFESYTPNNALRDPAISSIIGDRNGNILLVSKQGIDVLNPKTGTINYHGQEFGISDIDPNLNAYALDSAGNIWLGTQEGIIQYNSNVPPMEKWPATRINEVQLFLDKIDTTLREFSYERNHVSFDYIGFWYQDPSEVTYKLKLDGYDPEWVHSKNRFITYPDLPPGKYTFMVQSTATNHFDGALTKTYSFVINPPFYKTPWFYAGTILGGLAILFLIVRNREKKIKAKQRHEKEQIEFRFETLKNQVNPHFLFNSFNTLIGVIEEDKNTAVEYVEKLSDFYREILHNREKDVIPLSKELELIDNYYFLQLKRYKRNFKLAADVEEENKAKFIPPLTLQLLVENALKHNIVANERPLIVEIFTENGYVVVRNNLQRKVVHESSTGLGLNNIINRFKLLSDKKVKVLETTEYFAVYVPLIDQDRR